MQPTPTKHDMARKTSEVCLDVDIEAGVLTSDQALHDYEARKQTLCQQIKARGGHIRLAKKTSNLFRHRAKTSHNTVNYLQVSDFNHVLEVNPEQGYAWVEGMTTYDEAVQACLAYGCMPAVVPELKTITVGGALVGIGIESSSFRYGLVHETVQAFEVLLPGGRVLYCDAEGKHKDLFFSFPNSYGTLGYALKVKLKVVKVQPYVHLQHHHYADAASYYQGLQQLCRQSQHAAATDAVDSRADFVEGCIFATDKLYITQARMIEQAPYSSDYTHQNIYYKSISQRTEDYMTIYDYIWRWDTDWFWCSKAFGAQQPWIRRLLGKSRLNSQFYTKVMRWAKKNRCMQLWQRYCAKPTESVIQDVCIPIQHAAEFLDFFQREIGITPIWNCPLQSYAPQADFPLFAYSADQLHINFGFWDMVPTKQPAGYYNRLIEAKVVELGGMKSLYSNVFYSKEQFGKIYNQQRYQALKQQYDPQMQLGDLYHKCTEKVL